MSMRWIGKNNSTTATAWTLSIVIHSILFLAFGGARFSGTISKQDDNRPRADVTAQMIKASENKSVTPKPRVKRIFPKRVSLRPDRKPMELPTAAKLQLTAEDQPDFNITHASSDELSADNILTSSGTAFFGQFTEFRKICYVVDASGSMHGRLGLVKEQLRSSIADLKPDQYFYVIFFKNGNVLLESGYGNMHRASPSAKSKAYTFIDNVRPGGATNAVNALRRAMEIRDSLSNPPEQLYFLTDGFDLGEGSAGFSAGIESMRQKLAPNVRINTIGFWTEQTDVEILTGLAKLSGGQFTNID